MTDDYGQLPLSSSSDGDDDGDGDEQQQELTPEFAGDEQYSLPYSPAPGLGPLAGTNRNVSEQTAGPSSNHRHSLSSRQRRPSSSRAPSPPPIFEQDGSDGCSTGLGGLDGCCCCCCCCCCCSRDSWRARGSSYSDWLPQFALDENDDDDDDGDESSTPLTSPRSTKPRKGRTSSPTRRSPVVVAVPVPVIDVMWLPNNAPTLERRLDALCEDQQRILGAERTARARLQQLLLGLGPAPALAEARLWAGNAAQLRNWGALLGRQIQETAMAIKRAGGMWA